MMLAMVESYVAGLDDSSAVMAKEWAAEQRELAARGGSASVPSAQFSASLGGAHVR